jgi:hypothetical protein
MLVQGYYWSPDVDDPVLGTYWTTFEQQFHGGGRGLERFLPALAIRDRMVLVPQGQNETLEAIGSNEPPPPPLQRGVLEVDFEDPAAMEQAFETVGRALRAELREELSAYQSFQLSDRLDLDAASAHLGVPSDLLRHALREQTQARELILKQVRCSLQPATIVKDVQTRVALSIDNPSAVDLGELRVQLRGPTSGLEISPERVPIQLPAESSARADFSVAATREGEFVLEALFLDAVVDEARVLLPVQQLWITSVIGG